MFIEFTDIKKLRKTVINLRQVTSIRFDEISLVVEVYLSGNYNYSFVPAEYETKDLYKFFSDSIAQMYFSERPKHLVFQDAHLD